MSWPNGAIGAVGDWRRIAICELGRYLILPASLLPFPSFCRQPVATGVFESNHALGTEPGMIRRDIDRGFAR